MQRWCQPQILPLLVALTLRLQPSDATVYTYYGYGSLEERFESAPMGFGKPWRNNMFYEAELVFDKKNPNLCTNHTLGTDEKQRERDSEDDDEYNYADTNKHVVFLAEEGGCSVQHKIRTAEKSKPGTGFMLLYQRSNQQTTDEEELGVSTNSSVRFMSLSWETARALVAYYDNIANHGSGAWVAMKWDKVTKFGDGYDVDDYYDLDAMNNNSNDIGDPSLGLFFVLVFFSAFFFLFAAAHQQRNINRQRHNHDTSLRSDLGGFVGRNLITLSDIDRYLVASNGNNPCLFHRQKREKVEERQNEGTELVSRQCAICIEEIEIRNGETEGKQDDHLTLPCRHTFHTDCIRPWLTERQGTCPLCKFDVYQHVQEAAALDFSLPPEWISAFDNTRSRIKSFITFPLWETSALADETRTHSPSSPELEMSVSSVSSLSSVSQEDDVLSTP